MAVSKKIDDPRQSMMEQVEQKIYEIPEGESYLANGQVVHQ